MDLWYPAVGLYQAKIQRRDPTVLKQSAEEHCKCPLCPYVRNSDIHRDLKMDTVDNEIKKFARRHEDQLHQHVNPEAIQLLDNSQLVRRLISIGNHPI